MKEKTSYGINGYMKHIFNYILAILLMIQFSLIDKIRSALTRVQSVPPPTSETKNLKSAFITFKGFKVIKSHHSGMLNRNTAVDPDTTSASSLTVGTSFINNG